MVVGACCWWGKLHWLSVCLWEETTLAQCLLVGGNYTGSVLVCEKKKHWFNACRWEETTLVQCLSVRKNYTGSMLVCEKKLHWFSACHSNCCQCYLRILV